MKTVFRESSAPVPVVVWCLYVYLLYNSEEMKTGYVHDWKKGKGEDVFYCWMEALKEFIIPDERNGLKHFFFSPLLHIYDDAKMLDEKIQFAVFPDTGEYVIFTHL